MNNRKMVLVVVSALGCILLFAQQKRTASVSDLSGSDKANLNNAVNLFDQGRQVFRFTTFDDQTFWEMRLNSIRRSREQNLEVSVPA